MGEAKVWANIQEVANGYVVATADGEFVFTSVNTALKFVRDTMNPKDVAAE